MRHQAYARDLLDSGQQQSMQLAARRHSGGWAPPKPKVLSTFVNHCRDGTSGYSPAHNASLAHARAHSFLSVEDHELRSILQLRHRQVTSDPALSSPLFLSVEILIGGRSSAVPRLLNAFTPATRFGEGTH